MFANRMGPSFPVIFPGRLMSSHESELGPRVRKISGLPVSGNTRICGYRKTENWTEAQ